MRLYLIFALSAARNETTILCDFAPNDGIRQGERRCRLKVFCVGLLVQQEPFLVADTSRGEQLALTERVDQTGDG